MNGLANGMPEKSIIHKLLADENEAGLAAMIGNGSTLAIPALEQLRQTLEMKKAYERQVALQSPEQPPTVLEQRLGGLAMAGGGMVQRRFAEGTQEESDRQKLSSFWDWLKSGNRAAGAAIADVAALPIRGVVGAYDAAVVRPMRALGANAAYLSPHLVPAGADPESMTPFYDTNERRGGAAPPAAVQATQTTQHTDREGNRKPNARPNTPTPATASRGAATNAVASEAPGSDEVRMATPRSGLDPTGPGAAAAAAPVEEAGLAAYNAKMAPLQARRGALHEENLKRLDTEREAALKLHSPSTWDKISAGLAAGAGVKSSRWQDALSAAGAKMSEEGKANAKGTVETKALYAKAQALERQAQLAEEIGDVDKAEKLRQQIVEMARKHALEQSTIAAQAATAAKDRDMGAYYAGARSEKDRELAGLAAAKASGAVGGPKPMSAKDDAAWINRYIQTITTDEAKRDALATANGLKPPPRKTPEQQLAAAQAALAQLKAGGTQAGASPAGGLQNPVGTTASGQKVFKASQFTLE